MRRLSLVFFGVVLILALIGSALFFLAASYAHRVLAGVHVGDVALGGLDRQALVHVLRERVEEMNDRGIFVEIQSAEGSHTMVIQPVVITEETTQELIHVDIDAAADALLSYGKRGDALDDMFTFLRVWATHPSTSLAGVVIDTEHLRAAIEGRMTSDEVPVHDASILIQSIDPLLYEIHDGTPGISYAYDEAVNDIISQWNQLQSPKIFLRGERQEPQVTKRDVERIIHRIGPFFHHGTLTLSFVRDTGAKAKEWTISSSMISTWVYPEKTLRGELIFGLQPEKLRAFLDTIIKPVIDKQPKDAKFRVDEQGRVIEFSGSSVGMVMDSEGTMRAIQDIMTARTQHDGDVPSIIPIVVSYVEPTITTGEANHLGITEILGVGTSNFSGSPVNRIKNIRHAVERLNGVLVKPGEIFSTLAHVGPFEETDGYVPELVIKGDALQPEIGGGLCQVGTTLFRMAMNSGMPITTRRNHSLVVSYYGDPRNGNPGTDATIYDPAPDFRFENDTQSHVLIEADMSTTTGDMFFTLWGTNDGRSASYTAPIVSKWISAPEKKVVETTKLPPGETKCQKAFRGAEASFVYGRMLPTGEYIERVFESYYRPLPETCLVGVLDTNTSSTTPEVPGLAG